ncbi:MAG: hypothetical protein BA066_07180 [Candidatus Korarchaeota archaeon NZ13-K]|nr:MAG: hypothetical protein BA066_07180 [Candidatus Korarchaeota archaeon NZ13-K]
MLYVKGNKLLPSSMLIIAPTKFTSPITFWRGYWVVGGGLAKRSDRTQVYSTSHAQMGSREEFPIISTLLT